MCRMYQLTFLDLVCVSAARAEFLRAPSSCAVALQMLCFTQFLGLAVDPRGYKRFYQKIPLDQLLYLSF